MWTVPVRNYPAVPLIATSGTAWCYYSEAACGLTQDIDQRDVGFLFSLIERRYLRKSTIVCSLYSPADWRARLGGSGEDEWIANRLSEGAIRIDMGETNVRRLTAERR